MMKKVLILVGVVLLSLVLTSEKTYLKLDKVTAPAPSKTEVVPEVIRITYPSPPKWITKDYIWHLKRLCFQKQVPFLLVCKMIERESGWVQDTHTPNYNSDGKLVSIDHGRFQINSKNIKFFIQAYGQKGKRYDLIHNAYDNAEIAIAHLRDCYDSTGSWTKAVQAYNAGLKRVLAGTVPASTLRYQQYVCPVEDWWLSIGSQTIAMK